MPLIQPGIRQPARILVIEDSEADIQLLRLALDHEEDYQLEVLKDGEEAMLFVHEHRTGVREPEPCVILLDVQCRVMTEWQSCARFIPKAPPFGR